MGFFQRGGEQDEQDGERARIEAGGIPTAAEARLRELAGDGRLFTSGLSVNEFALLGSLQPLGQVMGASVVRTGRQYLPALSPGVTSVGQWFGPTVSARAVQARISEPSLPQVRNYLWHNEVVCELDVLSDAWNLARRRALDRLAEEARLLEAHAVVGVRLHRGDHDLGRGTVEYMVTGTAVRIPEADPPGWPILTDVTAQDYWRLHHRGHEPVGLLATTAVVFASPPRAVRLRRARTTRRNQELQELTQAFQAARDTVRARLYGQVSDAHGTGAVGVELSHAVHREKLAVASSLQSGLPRGWHRGRLGIPYYVSGGSDVERPGWVITMHAAGTAVRRRAAQAPAQTSTTIRMG